MTTLRPVRLSRNKQEKLVFAFVEIYVGLLMQASVRDSVSDDDREFCVTATRVQKDAEWDQIRNRGFYTRQLWRFSVAITGSWKGPRSRSCFQAGELILPLIIR